MNWIEAIFSRLAELWPCTRVETGSRAVLYINGRAKRVLEPGIHCTIWWMNQIRPESVQIDTINLPTQTETTLDGVEVSYSVNFIYQVVDPLKKQTRVREFVDSLSDLAMIFLARIIRDSSYEWVRDNRNVLEAQLSRLTRRYARAWGVKIHEVGMTDFARAPLLRHMGDVTLHVNA